METKSRDVPDTSHNLPVRGGPAVVPNSCYGGTAWAVAVGAVLDEEPDEIHISSN